MPIPDWPSLSYGTTDNMVYEYQVQDMDKLWDEQVARVSIRLDGEIQGRVQEQAQAQAPSGAPGTQCTN